MAVGTGWTLKGLQEHWGSAYKITEKPGGMIRFERRDDQSVVHANTPAKAHSLIMADYRARPVPRDARC